MLLSLPAPLFDWAGHLGVALYLGSYGLLQAGVIRGNSLTYTLLNLSAASFVLMSLAVAFNLSSALIQISWIVISIIGLIRIAIQNRRIHFTATEHALLDAAFPHIPKAMARRFLDAGTWHAGGVGLALTTEAEPVEALHFLADGHAEVVSAGKRIAEIDGGWVGELNVMQGGPASASVRLLTPSTVFTISRRVLRKLADRDGDFRLSLDSALTHDTAAKLMRANRQLAQDLPLAQARPAPPLGRQDSA